MSRMADDVMEKAAPAAQPSIDIGALRRAPVQSAPFPYLIVPGFVREQAMPQIGTDFPKIAQAGSFPLASLRYGPAFAAFIRDLESDALRGAVGEKLDIDLSASPSMVTVRGVSRAADGKIHTDSKSKLVTALLYMNDVWESPKGRLRLVRSPDDLNDIVAEVPPDAGTLLLFRNQQNAWHGFEPYSGPRRVVQLNWVTSASVVRREQTRHRISAFFKRLKGA
jgi:SM-20-related protein